MKEKLLNILACPKCKAEFSVFSDSIDEGEIREGSLTCLNGHTFYIKDFLPSFSEQFDYVNAFDFIHKNKKIDLSSDFDRKISEDITEREFKAQTGFDPKMMKGKLALDVGCGGGRFIKYLEKFDVETVGIDNLKIAVSRCIRSCKKNIKSHFIQADLFNLPFKEKSFDFIYSLGVLHHTPDPKKAFIGLVKYLKPGGRIAVWLYSNIEKTYISDKVRHLTKHIPKPLLFSIGFCITGFYGPFLKMPIINGHLKKALYNIRLPWHDHWNWRMHSFMDWYGPTYQSKHSYDELKMWLKEAGLKDIALCPYPVSAAGSVD